MAKSTTSSSEYWRIGTTPPRWNTSGAPPLMARGCSIGSTDTGILMAGAFLAARTCFGSLPWIAAIEIHPHVAARARRAAEADLIPSNRMRIVGADDVVQKPLREEHLSRQIAPGIGLHVAFLHRGQHVVLLKRRKLVKGAPVLRHRFGLQCGKAAPPRLAQRWQSRVAIPVAAVGMQFLIDHCGERHGTGAVGRLGDDAVADGAENAPLRIGEELMFLRIDRQALVDHRPRLLVPRRSVALCEDVIAWITIRHRPPHR